MKKIILVLVLITSTIAFANERRELTITSVDDVSTITVKNGCTMKIERRFWFDKKKKIDCSGLILKKVIGTSTMGKEVEVENVLIFPILDIQDTKNITEAIKYQMNGDIPDGLTLELSNLRYYSKLLKLSDVTLDKNDTSEVVLGGISLRFKLVQVLNGGRTFTQNRTINSGVN